MVNPCSLCTARCCKEYLITVTSFDVLRIAERTGKNAEEFAELSPPKILNLDNDTVLECYEKGERYDYLLTLKSRPCVFLQNDRCSIHEFAPWVCRLYPHRSDDGKVTARALCPTVANILFRLKKPDLNVRQYQERIRAYQRIVHEWNKKRGRKEDCLGFLMGKSREELRSGDSSKENLER